MKDIRYLDDRMLYWFAGDDFGVDYITNDYGVSVELSGDNYESQTFFIKGE